MRLTKAYIVSKKGNTYRVRIPVLHGIEGSSNCTPEDELPYATVCSLKGANNIYSKGDIVYVDFEENDYAKPVIMGSLILTDKSKTFIEIDVDKLGVKEEASLPKNTSIGNVTSQEISSLQGVTSNIQLQFNNILNCNSTYSAIYKNQDFDAKTKWVLEDNGLIVTSHFQDVEDDSDIDTYEYVQATKKTGDKSWELPSGTVVKQSDAYDRDKLFRLNWQGVNVVKNDTVKMSYGLYARNYWDIESKKVNNEDLAQPEYTWRPTIQSYINKEDKAMCEMVAEDENKKKINTGYYPYSLQLNPDGGDVYAGRAGVVSIIDHHDEDWHEGANDKEKQGLRIGDIFLFVDSDSKLKQQVVSTGVTKNVGSGEGGGGSNFFVYNQCYHSDDGNTWVALLYEGQTGYTGFNEFTLSGTIYRISLDGTKIYYSDKTVETTYINDEVIINGNKFSKYSFIDATGNTHYIAHRAFVTPYLPYYNANIANKRQVAIEGLYEKYKDGSTYDLERMYSGFIEANLSVILTVVNESTFTNNQFTYLGVNYSISVNSSLNGTVTGGGNTYTVTNGKFVLKGSSDFANTTFEIIYNAGSTTAGKIKHYLSRTPLTATAKVQLSTVIDMQKVNGTTGDQSIITMLDLSTEQGINWNNLSFHFMVPVVIHLPNVTETSTDIKDLIVIDTGNGGNYISVTDLSSDNVIQMYKAQLTDDNGMPAKINVNFSYIGVDATGITESTITPIDNDSVKEHL